MGHARFLLAWRLTRGLAQITIGAGPFADLSAGKQTKRWQWGCARRRESTPTLQLPSAFVQLILSLSGFEEL